MDATPEMNPMPPTDACCTPDRTGATPQQPQTLSPSTRKSSDEGMVKLDGGEFLMGTEDKMGFPGDGEGPIRKVTVAPFLIDEATVTNEQFTEFINDTQYVTEAERFGWSFSFHHFVSDTDAESVEQRVAGADWWWRMDGADWRHPDGPESDISDRMDHPVTQVSFNDANVFAKWAGKRLPTEAEWEFAARGGHEQRRYAWGNALTLGGEHMCNIWQGDFPRINSLEDGFHGTAPARAYEPNDFGLYCMAGNIWEWCSDWWGVDWGVITRDNPVGPEKGDTKVTRGGSYLCHSSYCNRYRVAARTSNTPDSATSNMGFRCARSV